MKTARASIWYGYEKHFFQLPCPAEAARNSNQNPNCFSCDDSCVDEEKLCIIEEMCLCDTVIADSIANQ